MWLLILAGIKVKTMLVEEAPEIYDDNISSRGSEGEPFEWGAVKCHLK